jgi:two-component system sensor histidine kinase/response regulator
VNNSEIKSGSEGAASPPPPKKKINSPSRILVVDDDVYMRDLMVKTLTRSGYEKVDTARDGAEAWQELLKTSYHLVITDHVMPKITGLELIKKMRSKDMQQPVIMVSGTIPTEELARNPGLRIDAILSKPFTATELLATLEAIVRAARSSAVAKRNPTPHTGAQPIAPAQGQTDSPFRILVVDDDRDSRQFSVKLLISSGYEAEGVNDGTAGWEALQTYDYDLVITDNHMPRMTGLEMIEKLNSAHMTIPIIMATGNLPMDEFARRPWLKPDAMLQKPFTNDDLLGMVRNVLGTDGGNEDVKEARLPKLP